MKKLVLLAFVFTTINICAFCQDDIPVRQLPTEVFRTITMPKDSLKWTWKRGGVFNFNMAQGSQKNWAAGGDNFSLALTTYLNYYLYYQHKNQNWDNNLNYNLGYIQTTTLGAEKNDDRLDFLSKYDYNVDTSKKLAVTGLFNVRTQFFDGFTYNGTVATFSSTFLSPGYVLLSLGMDYKPIKSFSFFLSAITNRTTIVANPTLSEEGQYGVDSGRHVLNQFGAFASLGYQQTIVKNVTYKGRLDLFSDYANNPQNVDLNMINALSFKINKYLSATYALNLIYDDNVRQFGPLGTSPALQMQSQLGIGLSVPFKVVRHA